MRAMTSLHLVTKVQLTVFIEVLVEALAVNSMLEGRVCELDAKLTHIVRVLATNYHTRGRRSSSSRHTKVNRGWRECGRRRPTPLCPPVLFTFLFPEKKAEVWHQGSAESHKSSRGLCCAKCLVNKAITRELGTHALPSNEAEMLSSLKYCKNIVSGWNKVFQHFLLSPICPDYLRSASITSGEECCVLRSYEVR